MPGLAACIEHETRREEWEDYTGNCIGAITTRLFKMSGAEQFELPLYGDLREKCKPKPMLTAAEIKARVIAKLE